MKRLLALALVLVACASPRTVTIREGDPVPDVGLDGTLRVVMYDDSLDSVIRCQIAHGQIIRDGELRLICEMRP